MAYTIAHGLLHAIWPIALPMGAAWRMAYSIARLLHGVWPVTLPMACCMVHGLLLVHGLLHGLRAD